MYVLVRLRNVIVVAPGLVLLLKGVWMFIKDKVI